MTTTEIRRSGRIGNCGQGQTRDQGQGLKRLTAALTLAFLCAASAPAPLSAQGAESLCTVQGVMGTVKVFSSRDRKASRDDAATWSDARLNMPLREGDVIATKAESEVRIATAEGSTVRLRENTTLEIAALKGGLEGATRLKLADGSIVANVKRMAGSKSTFELETPTSLAAIRGTTVELDSRKSGGTTLKTFDGKVQAAPSDGKGKKDKNFTDVGNYQMAEIAPGQKSAKARAVPSFYRQKSTKILSEYEASELTGFTRVVLTYDELQDIQNRFADDGIAAAVGVGESDDEMTARTISADQARATLATAMSTQVQRISESYAQNIGGEAKKIWEEGIRQITDVSVRGSAVHTTITQFSPEIKRFKVYSLMVLDPNRLKGLFGAENSFQEEAELRAKKDDMMSKLDASINAFGTRYHDR